MPEFGLMYAQFPQQLPGNAKASISPGNEPNTAVLPVSLSNERNSPAVP